MSIHQGPIDASVLPLWDGPLMANLAKILTNVSSQMCATHKLRASITLEDLNAVVTWDGEGKGSILYVQI